MGTKAEQARLLLDDLRRPEAYPAPRPSEVTQVTTHISWVFLTDREVWKLKRPVDYGFVNYTTLERRRRCCEDEARLNRRLAPDVYLGVVPVRLGPQGHGFGADGEIVDYAVRMRRLSDEQSAEALLRRGTLTPDQLTRLAERLARFFADAAPAPEAGVETVCDEATLRERLRRRATGPSVSDAGEGLLDRVRAEFEPVTELGAGEHVRVDTAGPPDATVRAALEALRV